MTLLSTFRYYPEYQGNEPCTWSDNPDADWFGSDEEHTLSSHVAARRQECAQCPLLKECMRYAVLADEHFGIWGATTEAERRVIRQLPEWPVWDASRYCWVLALR